MEPSAKICRKGSEVGRQTGWIDRNALSPEFGQEVRALEERYDMLSLAWSEVISAILSGQARF